MGRFGRTPRSVWAISTVFCLGLASLGLVLAVAKPTAAPPIELQFMETPVFLGAHEHTVSAIAFSPDGKTVATGTGALRLWDTATGRLKSIHRDDAVRGIDGLAFSPDGKLVAAVGGIFGKEAVLWNVDSGRIAMEIEEPIESTQEAAASPKALPFNYKGKPTDFRVRSAVAFSPDGRILATAPDGVVLRDVQSGKILRTLMQPTKGVKSLAFTSDGKTLIAASDDKKVRLWSVPAGELEATLDGPTQPLSAVAVSPNGMHIVASSSAQRSLFDRTPVGYVWYWERPNSSVRKIEIGNAHVRQVAFIAPNTVLATAGRELYSLDMQSGDAIRPRKIWSHSDDLYALAVSPDHRLAASGGRDRTVDLVDVSTGKLVHRLPGLMDNFSSLAASKDGKRFATATIDRRFSRYLPAKDLSFAVRYATCFSGDANKDRLQASQVRIWSMDDGKLQMLLPLPASQATAVAFVPSSNQLAVGGWIPGKGGTLSLWDLSSGKPSHDFPAHTAEILSLAVSPDGKSLAAGDAEGNLDLWDVSSGAKIRSHKHDHRVEAATFSADGKMLATGDGARTVRVFDASSGTVVRTLKSRAYIQSLDFSPDGTLLAAGTREPGLELSDLRTTAAARTLKASGDYTEGMPGFVAFSRDGRFVVCGGHGKDIAVFDAKNGKLHCELRGHAHPATTAVFLPDGRLLSGGEERALKLWDLKLRKNMATWIVEPADQQQNWGDEWVGFNATGKFVGSPRLDRLVGWLTGGDALMSAEHPHRRQRVESLFGNDDSIPPKKE